MSWHTITVRIPEDLRDAIVGEFSADHIAGVWERAVNGDDGGYPLELVLYFDQIPPLVDARIGRLFARNGFSPSEAIAGIQEREDWTREWRKGFTSFPLGRGFMVVPSWETPPESARDRHILHIDPGLAFGTGTHETTQLMVEAIESITRPGDSVVLDLGTGSAILAIAAAKLGGARLAACDIDPDAVQVARSNLKENHAAVSVFVGSVDAVRSAAIDVVLANLTADVIIDVVDDVTRVLKRNGTAVLSGILDIQADAVRREMESRGYRIDVETFRGEWVAMVACRGD
jgi:ribosomal protein L11 methyltransferase